MSNSRWTIAGAVLIAAALATLLGAQSDNESVAIGDDELGQLWFVELSGAPAADGGSAADLAAEKAEFRRAATARRLRYQERYAFDTLWNGFSVRVDRSQLGVLSRIQGVKSIYPVAVLRASETREPIEADVSTALAMTGADVARDTLGLTGHGVRVAIIDSGIDYDHPDLGGCFGPGCRVAYGADLVGDRYDAEGAPADRIPHPDPDPDDCIGHGTHVAGIAGANGAITGVAPGVTFGAYKVFGCEGSTSSDVIIAAMELALADGTDVLNASVGSAFLWPQDPVSRAADRLVSRGVAVVASSGNGGGNGLYSAGAPGVGAKVIAVASFDNTLAFLPFFTVSPDDKEVSFFPADEAPTPPVSGSLPVMATGTPSISADACTSQPLPNLTGKVVLIRRGTCTFYEKSRKAELAGASAVVIYNNVGGYVSPSVEVPNPPLADGLPVTIPVVSILAADGLLIHSRLLHGPVTLGWTNQSKQFALPSAGVASSFSAYGASPDLALKPDIGAPGGFIFSTYPLESGGYATLSGTSMAAPHVAGAVALLLEARPDTRAQAVRSILQNSADPKNWWGNPALGFIDNVHRQGAGMLDIPGAILATTTIEPSKLSLGESEAGPVTHTLTVKNQGSTSVTYDLSHRPALSTGPNTFTPAFLTAFASVAFSASSVAVPAGGSATVDVTITANGALPNKSLYGGYLVFTPRGGGDVYSVPYAGFKGDYQSFPVLTPTLNGFPWLAQLVGSDLFKRPSGATYSLTGDDVPFFVVHLDHQSRSARFEVFEANSGRSWHRALELAYLPRNSTSASFFAFPWDGTTRAGNKDHTVPDGTYVVKLSVLKALGDAANPAHWETWTSPIVTIARP